MQKRSKDKIDITKFLPPTPQKKKGKTLDLSPSPFFRETHEKGPKKREMKKKNDIFLQAEMKKNNE